MELKDFVKETLTQIMSGIIEAQNSDIIKESKSAIVPSGQFSKDIDVRNKEISFDVAVTTDKSTGTKGGIGIFVGPVGIGSQGQTDKSNTNVSRIKFTVPVYYPFQSIKK